MANVKQVIAVRTDLHMRKGKIAAQVAHAAMKFLVDKNEMPGFRPFVVNSLSDAEVEWLTGSFTKIVAGCDSQQELFDLVERAHSEGISAVLILDAGRTEFGGIPTYTCAAFGPDESDKIDKITGSLKLI